MTSQKLVYLLDDDELVLNTLSASFENAGFHTDTFSNTDMFLQRKLVSDNACIILDLNMPDESGIEIQKHLKESKVSLPIIVYTGFADVESTVKVMEQGATTLIQKPAEFSVLLNATQQAIVNHAEHSKQNSTIAYACVQLAKLSKREKAVAEMVAEGYSAAEVAKRLFISVRTVEAHKTKIFTKLDIKSAAALAKLVILADSV